MDFSSLSFFTALLVTLTALLLLLFDDWRAGIALLAAQYAGVFVFIAIEWPLPIAVTALIAGWMASSLLGMAMVSGWLASERTGEDNESEPLEQPPPPRSPRLSRPASLGRPVFLLSFALVSLLVFSQIETAVDILPDINPWQAWAGLILVGLGFLKLGFHDQVLSVILGLLTVLSGFEIVYASIEASPLVAGLLALVTLGLAFAGAYMLLAPSIEEIG